MADLANVINVALQAEGAAVSRDNPNVVMIITSDSNFLNSNNRTAIYTNPAAVAGDFGTLSEANQFAQVAFSQSPNAVDGGGLIVVGYWRAVAETVAASAGVLRSSQLSESSVVGQLINVADGSFSFDLDGSDTSITGLDFRAATTLSEIASVLNGAITGATVTVSNEQIVITSSTTGASSAVTAVSAHTSGTFVGDVLKLSAATGATATDGAAGSTLSPETKVEAATALKALVNFRGAMFIDNPTDVESLALAQWGQANDVLFYDVFNDVTNLNRDASNVVWDIRLRNLTNYRMQYRRDGNRLAAAAYMSRAHVVNFAGENTAITMNLKELVGVPSEVFTQTEITNAQNVGLDLYVPFKNVPKLLTSGANDFTDNRYNLLAFLDAVQTDAFNVLGTTPTKLAQTEEGVNALVDQVEATCQQFVTAGVFAPGSWTSSARFGDREQFDRNIEQTGFYVLAQPLTTQSTDSRQRRESPVIQVAVKNAGAIHSADIIINFNL